MLRDAAEVSARMEALARRAGGGDSKRALAELEGLTKRLDASAAERAARLARRPAVRYPHELPISAMAREIVQAVKRHRAVIVSGETGCGKSTQIPKMCLEAGRGVAGRIACTQPRRIAAVTIAHRIAEELKEGLGRSVGYKIRFQDRAPRSAYIKVLTDGMLLAETQGDRGLHEYDTLIIDEAHERSLNIDFLLGLARKLIDERPELRVVITSATLDTEKFAEAFGGAPVIAVKGRLYPVEVVYRPPDRARGEDEEGYVELAAKAVSEIKTSKPPGDILVFMPAEQDILETCRILEGKKYPGTTVLPLYARLPAGQQGRVYSVAGPKIVVATNVAETSLTIPGIRYVVDTGLARISQYLPGTRINSLPISPVSRSSADQRCGRCGRVQAGSCVRLYSEKDYEARPRFTPPEIFRSNLAEVILRMIDLRLGDPLRFPFVDKPSVRLVRDGYETLVELGAIRKEDGAGGAAGAGGETGAAGAGYTLTERGRLMARMPLDPRISRMLLEARREGCLEEAAVIASALSIRDPRERPPERAAEADARQAVFNPPDSDFLTVLNIWSRFHGSFEELDSQSRRRRFCREHFLSFPRMQEWTLIHGQVLEIIAELRLGGGAGTGAAAGTAGEKARYDAVHRAVLSGLLSNIAARKERNIYTAAKGREAMLFPGSVLFSRPPAWIMAAEMVKTARLYARTAARIDPAWVEPLAGDLCRRHYSDPHWDKDLGEVRAKERVTLFGLEVVSDRPVPYGPVNAEEAHGIFVREALVGGKVKNPPDFLKRNLALAARIEAMEDKLRRRDILAGEAAQAAFYGRRLAGVTDLAGLRAAVEREGGDDFLRMNREDLLVRRPDKEELARFPDRLPVGEWSFKANYKFEPGAEDDGVTVNIPHAALAGVTVEKFEWGVPGQFREKVVALIKGLPRRYRKLLVPVSETAQVIVEEMPRQTERSLYGALAEFVKHRFRTDIPAREWEKAALPEHLRMRVAVLDGEGKAVLAGRDIAGLIKKSGAPPPAPTDTAAWKAAREKWEREGSAAWDFGDLPESVPAGPLAEAFPGLEPASDRGANLRLFNNKEEARESHRRGVAALLLVKHAKDLEFLRRYLLLPEEAGRAALHFGGKAVLEKALHESLRREVFERDVRTEAEFRAYGAGVVKSLFEKGHELVKAAGGALEAYLAARRALSGMKKDRGTSKTVQAFVEEIEAELGRLMPKDFLSRFGLERLGHLPRYLKALELRIERARQGLEKDRQKAAQVEPFVTALKKLRREAGEMEGGAAETVAVYGEAGRGASAAAKGAAGGRIVSAAKRAAVEEFRWLVEEFRVSLFAPELRTAVPVSAKRLEARLKEIAALE
ncbi:MAG: ATP-dependent RNA helicase HrpA [Candidatus Aminicenantes bacterium RBG_13_64_14]|nr:MAG: ATP-dependent RNA helicase HrpA [Candidatus Aminicenantes bacterium RBG_13_64_14]